LAARAPRGRHQVVAALVVRAHSVLLCHRSIEREWYPDVWDLPGGHVEEYESGPEALLRELREELGIVPLPPLGDHSFALSSGEFEMRVWVIRHWSGSPTNRAPDEHDEIGWFAAPEAVSLDLADSCYRGWILRTVSSG
jgi:8-oxo-dGTP diphosphatase